MKRNNTPKNEENFNKTLFEFRKAYSKPPTKSEYFFVVIWLALLPIIGIIGYVYDISWLFYAIGGIITLTEIVFLFVGDLRCLGSILLIMSCVIGYSITRSLWIGIMLGSCIMPSILVVGYLIIMCISGLATITGLFKKDD